MSFLHQVSATAVTFSFSRQLAEVCFTASFEGHDHISSSDLWFISFFPFSSTPYVLMQATSLGFRRRCLGPVLYISWKPAVRLGV